jgi:hypothetical protein
MTEFQNKNQDSGRTGNTVSFPSIPEFCKGRKNYCK